MSQKSFTFSQYRTADLTIWLFISCIFEYIVTLAATKWFPEQPYSVTLVFAFVALTTIRWNGYSALTALGCGVAYCIAVSASAQMYVIVCIGNLFSLLSLLFVKAVGKSKIEKSRLFASLFVAAVFVSVYIGRLVVSLFLGVEIGEVLKSVLYDVFSLVFAVVLILICRRQNGLFEDQKQYVKRIWEEEQNKTLQ